MLLFLTWFVVAGLGFFTLIFVVLPLTDELLTTSGSKIANVLTWAALILFSPVIVATLPVWGPIWGFGTIRRILSDRAYAKRCVADAVAAKGVPIPRSARTQLVRTVTEGAVERERAATKRLAAQTVIAHVEGRQEFRAALHERFDPDSWFAEELSHRYVLRSETTLLRDAARALSARDADTNANMRELLVRWRSAWETYYALSAGRRTKPVLTDIALHLPRRARPKG
ncbi:hypothetical protein GCM10011583_52670 [Streptomyces camponoticapitis]|uniref:Uncharacterized protein n=1 Tax=Streptomyces camponoticapitis TaxID=1616125 RepID=A0ABQ2EK62_9ACTN|nr:hypothetical protein [Streptomyces camponoticapitis]GGK14147.1 hypothetical protein GCM10011583_52670 [Streptomyces camponoticapitis]